MKYLGKKHDMFSCKMYLYFFFFFFLKFSSKEGMFILNSVVLVNSLRTKNW